VYVYISVYKIIQIISAQTIRPRTAWLSTVRCCPWIHVVDPTNYPFKGQHPAAHTGNIYMNTRGQLLTKSASRHNFFTATTPMFQLFGWALMHSGNIHIPAIRPIVILSSMTARRSMSLFDLYRDLSGFSFVSDVKSKQ